MKPSLLPIIIVAGMLGGCVSATNDGTVPATAGDRPAPRTYRDAEVASATPAHRSGTLEGRDAALLTRMFGAPRLDRREGPAHVLQFANGQCVLDAYLYPPRSGAEPVVTHVDVRSSDGANADPATCISALQRR